LTLAAVIPGQSAAEGKGIHPHAQHYGSPPRPAAAEDDILFVMAGFVPAIPIL
jgi:hypothetical protein